jgi:uncharacterized membrane protein (DUF485 family)
MLSRKDSQNNRQKSLKRRFLLILGIVFFALYFILGLLVIFWKELPFAFSKYQRWAFGALLIGYSFIRFIRLMQNSREDE